eukprot:12893_1
MLITLLLWFEFVIMCFIRPFLTASDRLCQFILRTFILFESSILVLNNNNSNIEPINVAVCSVTFVTLIISYIAACFGLYPMHPNSTVCSSCCCCCFIHISDHDHDNQSDDDDNTHTIDNNQSDNDDNTHTTHTTHITHITHTTHQLQTNTNGRFKSFSEMGSDKPLLNQNSNQVPNNIPYIPTFNSSQTTIATKPNQQLQQLQNEPILSPQINNNINQKRFIYSSPVNNHLQHLQETGFHKHYNSHTGTGTVTGTGTGTVTETDNNDVDDININLDTSQLQDHHHIATDNVTNVSNITNTNNNHNNGKKSFNFNSNDVSSVTTNTNNNHSMNYNKMKSDSRYFSNSIISIESKTKTNTNQ